MLQRISDKLHDVVRQISGKSHISEKNIRDAVEEIKIALLEADVNLRVVRRFVNSTIEEALGEKVLQNIESGQQFTKIVYDKLVHLLGDEYQDLNLKGPDTQSIILMMGLQGSGKTTTSAKLAYRLKKAGRRPFMIAADLVRPAAVKQLQVLGEQIDVPVYAESFPEGAEKDPLVSVRNGLAQAKRESYNTIIIDTTGRLHLDDVMMKQIHDINKLAQPDETLFVADAMTGQNAVTIAKEFEDRVGISGVILTKFDSDTRGGAALSIRSVIGKPLKFIGVGEKVEDLDPFHPERIASRILGMGDVVSLVEKAQEVFEEKEIEDLEKRMAAANFTLQDYLDQFARLRKMGSIGSILDMMPGMKGKVDPDKINTDELKKEEAIIQSMTKKERDNHRLLGPTRRRRIAKGSGTTVQDVNKLLKKFEKMRLMMKKVAKNKKLQQAMLKELGGDFSNMS